MKTLDYRVQLPVFEGPLDLLLYLIERQELDITQVSLARVTDQYLEYLQRMEERRAGELAEFLVIAAKLLLIKSRALLPQPPPPPEPGEEDVGEELVRQLAAYKRFKEVAAALRQREEEGWRSFVRLAPPPKIEPPLELNLSLDELVALVRQAFAIEPETPPVGQVGPPPQRISLEERLVAVEAAVTQAGRLTFRALLSEAASRLEIIITLLAVLELLKRQRIRVEQASLFGEIWISPQ
uniref:Segregation and condensation protein A n=1 Tax=uncultured prokaryote TaxID=198431 RepID=H5SKS0_9ZZZZ|nr:segregation and condensation protein A [uncultured prokaryote]